MKGASQTFFWGYFPTDVHVSIFWHSYYDTSWDFTREMEEEKLEFQDAIYIMYWDILDPTAKNK